ncbi:MAG: DUF4260 domain-containing protein [Polyangiaceae bacterium]|nr:DUF4260 domain-containing protein [Polyangiaceae bacterium]
MTVHVSVRSLSTPAAPSPVTLAAPSPVTLDIASSPFAVAGGPLVILRLEAALVLVLASLAYRALGGTWGWFAILFLVPDLAMLGYLVGPRAGAIGYNAAHSYLGPAILGAASAVLHVPALLPAACIWAAHVGFDRMLGYGLKYASDFGETHLGKKGRGLPVRERHGTSFQGDR